MRRLPVVVGFFALAAGLFAPATARAQQSLNLSVGVRHGYSVFEELPIALLVFGLPAACATLFWWRFSRGA